LKNRLRFDIYVWFKQFQNATEGVSRIIVEDLPLKVSRVRPLIEVNTKEEYNKKISEFVNPEMQKDYILE